MMSDEAAFRTLPSVDHLLRAPDLAEVLTRFGRAATTDALRPTLDETRRSIRADDPAPDAAALPATSLATLATTDCSNLRPLFNFSSRDLAAVARAAGVPLLNDLGSGTPVDLSRWALKREPTVAEGADLVTFSGDKLLGGPQAGFIVGRKDLVEAVNRNPLKRALRVDKIRIAGLAATLKLYRDPERLPTRRLLTRPRPEILILAKRLTEPVAAALYGRATVAVCACRSQIGSGALPVDTLPSAGLRLAAESGAALDRLAADRRALPRPIVGRLADGALVLDLGCPEDEAGLLDSLRALPR